jgi:hypothetical protein
MTIFLLSLSANGQSEKQLTKVEVTKDSVDFLVFWTTFRKAVLDNDLDKVMSMTKFPFETRGEMDGDPIVKYQKKDFKKVFHAILMHPTYWKEDGDFISTLEGINRTSNSDLKDIWYGWTRVIDLGFKKVNNKWTLTFAYLSIRDPDLWKR